MAQIMHNSPTNMSHNFSRVPQVSISRSQFISPYKYTSAIDAGFIYPFFMEEVLPGSSFNDSFTLFARLATPIKPIMDNLYLDTFYFFVPLRLLWDNFERFMGSQDDPDDSTDYLVPTIPAPAVTGFGPLSLFDYMGIPIAKTDGATPPVITPLTGFSIDAFHALAYNLCWNQFFRDENLQDSVYFNKGDGPHAATNFTLLRRGKRHDYFTSCLPFPQKGPAVDLPLTGNAPVYGDGKVLGLTDGTGTPKGLLAGSGSTLAAWSGAYNQTVGAIHATGTAATSKDLGVVTSGNSGLIADMQDVTGVTINQFRQAFSIQMLLENDARGGTRYVEILRAHFRVISPDFRLQRPEYIGGQSVPINVQPVPQTSATDATSPQGNLAAYGTGLSRGGYSKSFVEHGVILGMCSIRADLTYQSGLRRMWSRQTRYDFYWPAFAHLGEMAVLNKEIFLQGTSADELVFGYQEAWADYRYHPSLITGPMRSAYAQSLDIWHLSQSFTSLPLLNDTFIEDHTDDVVDRVVAVQDEPQFYLDVFGSLKHALPMPIFSTPGLVTRL